MDLLFSILANVGYLICGVLGYLMFKKSPPRLPKVAVVLMGIGGLALVTLLGGVISWASGLLTGGWQTAYTVAVTLGFVVLVYTVFNDLSPKLGKVQGGKADFSTGVRALLLPTFATATGGAVAVWLAGVMERGGNAIATIADRGF